MKKGKPKRKARGGRNKRNPGRSERTTSKPSASLGAWPGSWRRRGRVEGSRRADGGERDLDAEPRAAPRTVTAEPRPAGPQRTRSWAFSLSSHALPSPAAPWLGRTAHFCGPWALERRSYGPRGGVASNTLDWWEPSSVRERDRPTTGARRPLPIRGCDHPARSRPACSAHVRLDKALPKNVDPKT